MANKIVRFTTYKSDGTTLSGTPFVFGFTDKLGNNVFDNIGTALDADLEIPPPPPPGSASTGNPISTSYIDSMYVKVNDGTNDINAYQYFIDSSDNSDISLNLAVRDYGGGNVVFKYDVNDVSGVFTTLAITNGGWSIDLVGASVTGSGGSNPTVTENGDVRTVTLPHLANNTFYTMNLKQYVVSSGPTQVTQTITLNAGWNLISFYVDLNNAPPATVFASLISSSNLLVVTKYNSSFTAYDPTKPAFLNSLSTMTNEFGYWVKTNNADTISVNGIRFNGPLQLNAGWNLISYYLTDSLAPATVFASLISSSNLLVVTKYNLSFTAYDPTKPAFLNSLSTMTNGFGYWVKTNTAVSVYYL